MSPPVQADKMPHRMQIILILLRLCSNASCTYKIQNICMGMIVSNLLRVDIRSSQIPTRALPPGPGPRSVLTSPYPCFGPPLLEFQRDAKVITVNSETRAKTTCEVCKVHYILMGLPPPRLIATQELSLSLCSDNSSSLPWSQRSGAIP